MHNPEEVSPRRSGNDEFELLHRMMGCHGGAELLAPQVRACRGG